LAWKISATTAICFINFNLDLEILTGVQGLMPLNTKSYPFINFCVNGMQQNLSSSWLAVRIPMSTSSFVALRQL
jgi:hypothetical protein